MSVNGFMVDGIFSSVVAAGKHCVFATDGWDEILDTEIISMTF